MEDYNINSIEAALNLVNGESDESKKFREDIRKGGEELMKDVRGTLAAYRSGNSLLAAEDDDGDAGGALACSASQSDFKYE